MSHYVSGSSVSDKFDNFLYAPIGEDNNGLYLTVLLALARQNVDPWEEAAELCRLPGRVAMRKLTTMIETLPEGALAQCEPNAVAARLIVNDEWEPYAPGLKTLVDATAIRGRILLSFERAERETDPPRRDALLTFVIIGGGPTGVELAGTIAELAHENLRADFRCIDLRRARIVLIEAGPRILPSFTEDLAAYAHSALERLGVEIEVGKPVRKCNVEGVLVGDRHLPATTILWAAGVRASGAGGWLGAPSDRANRVKVLPDLCVPGHPEIFVIGDTATIDAWHGKPAPGIAPAAKQQGSYVVAAIKSRVRGAPPPKPFRYTHAGSLATIGKRCAIIDFGWIRIRGWIAWWIWGFAHIYF